MGGNKRKVLIIIFFFMVFAANGQKDPFRRGHYKGWEKLKAYSGKIGLNASAIGGNENYNNVNPKIGFNIGGSANFQFSNYYSLITELNIEQKGTNYLNQDASINSIYVTSPILLRFYLKKYRKYQDYKTIRFFANVGPYLGYLLVAKEKGEIANLDTFYILNNDIKKELNSFDAGIVIGAGFFLPSSRKVDIYFDFRYNLGLLSIRKNNPNFEGMNQSISISFGFVKYFKAR